MQHLAGNRIFAQRAPVAHRAVVIALCGVQFVDVLGVTVVITALPRMLATWAQHRHSAAPW